MQKRSKVSSANRSLSKYLDEIGHFEPLSPDDEIRLAIEAHNGSKDAVKKICEANLRFVVSVAKEYQGQGLPLTDLINEGNVGLIKAVDRYDETRGFKFISYAVWWIRQSILQALAEHSRIVRLPLNRVGTISKIAHQVEELEQLNERTPDEGEVAERLGLDAEMVADSMKAAMRHHSLDQPVFSGERNTLIDVLEDNEQAPPDRPIIEESLHHEINMVLKDLKSREREVLEMYFGLNRDYPMTLNEIGEEFNLTRERVRQIKEKAIHRLQHKTRRDQLRTYLG